jgi:hypothetical protein
MVIVPHKNQNHRYAQPFLQVEVIESRIVYNENTSWVMAWHE